MAQFRNRPYRSLRPIRRRLPRSAIPWWIAVVVLAVGTAAIVNGALVRAADAEARWRDTRSVIVATRSIEWGQQLAEATEVRRLPKAAIPDGALTEVTAEQVATAAIGQGEVVIAPRVSGQDAAGAAALLPAGTRALVIPLEVAGLPVQPGDRVDLLASQLGGLPVADMSSFDPARPVAREALVVVAKFSYLVVAVSESTAAKVAAGLGQGPLVPALAAPG